MGCWLLAGCGDRGFDDNREKWRANRPEEYVISICGAGFEPLGCTLTAVSGDTVVAAARSQSDAPSSGDWTFIAEPEQADPVEALFNDAEDAGDHCELRDVYFDDRFGYVTYYYNDCGEEGGGVQVRCFQPDTSDATRCMECQPGTSDATRCVE
ncbi:hypothetical protein ACSRUE_43465 [Sorangium sp. KYC3313]|uniref:hypothetical protein n=1 Tax=Sorangium sp. KYC3313 TaxID=3449740 RepID=UPI003F897C9E